MSIYSKYRFYLTIPNQGEVQVFPVNNELSWKWKYDLKLRTWRYYLDTELCFKNNDHKTFNALYEIEKQCNVCFKIDLRVEKCCNDIWKDHWNGYLPLRSGKWNLGTCTAEIKPRVDDVFSCIYRIWKDKKNLLDIENTVTIDTIIGEVICQTTDSLTPPNGFGWTAINTRIKNIFEDQQSQAPLFTEIEVQWCRECWQASQGVPDGSGWQLEGSAYYRPINLSNCQTLTQTYFQNTQDERDYYVVETIKECSYVDLEIDNALTLQSVLEYLFSDCELNICSDFFNINPVNDHPINVAYDCADLYLKNVVLFQASDVIRASALNNATIFEKCLAEVWCDLADRFQLQMWHDQDNNCIRIEHVSYRLDGTIFSMMEVVNNKIKIKDRYKVCLSGLWKYEYIKQEFPRLETFSDKTPTVSPDFNNASIAYPIECSDDDENTNEKKIEQKCTLTDIGGFHNKQQFEDDNDTLLSMFLVSLDEDNQIISSVGAISGETILNAPMSWANIIECYHLHNRPLPSGIMNGNDKVFLSTLPQKKQNGISVRMCCDKWENFNPNMGIKTQFGTGYIDDEIEYKDPSEMASFNLGHPCY